MVEYESSGGLLPSDDEIVELLKRMAFYDPKQIPSTIFQLYCLKIFEKEIDKLKEKLDHEISELMKKLDQ